MLSSYVRKQNWWFRILKYTLFLQLIKWQARENARWTIWLKVLAKMETEDDNNQANINESSNSSVV